jgi:hypothetical protein
LTRVSIKLRKVHLQKMDCRVKPGNDTFFHFLVLGSNA